MTATAAPSTETTTTWAIDPAHSLVEFAVKHMMFTTVKGRFTGVSGQIVTEGESPALGTVEAEIDAASIDSRDEKRDGHLRSADFLDAETHPSLSFVGSRVEPLAGDRFRVIGDLTIRDTTREVTFDATFNGRGTNPWGQEVAGYSAETTIDRGDYGLTFNAPLAGGGVLVGQEVRISIEIQAAKHA